MKYLKPSITNIAGAICGVLAAYLWSLHSADYAIHFASAYRLNVVASAVLVGSAIALGVSFIVTHILECLMRR